MTGVGGIASTVTVAVAEGMLWHPLVSDTSTKKLPFDITRIVWLVSPFDHKYESEGLDVRSKLSPSQKLTGPDAVITGCAGAGLAVTRTGSDGTLLQAPSSNTVTV
jgi:hypothetical protein